MQIGIPHYRKTQLLVHVQNANSATELDHAFDTFKVDLPLMVIPLYMLSFCRQPSSPEHISRRAHIVADEPCDSSNNAISYLIRRMADSVVHTTNREIVVKHLFILGTWLASIGNPSGVEMCDRVGKNYMKR
jgi:hypothetical protein